MARFWLPLTRGWRFVRHDEASAHDASFNDDPWEEVTIPHCFNAADTFTPVRGYYRGPAWYRIRLPEVPSDKHVELDALGAFAVTDVWLDGEHLGQYMGGFTGFNVDITGKVKPEGGSLLSLRVTNEHDPEVLPGKDIPDYDLYGGIYREIGLRITEPLRIADRGLILSTPKVSAESGQVHLAVRVANGRDVAVSGCVSVIVESPDGQAVSQGSREFLAAAGAERLVSVPVPAVSEPALWSPDEPNLYTLRATVSEGNSTADEVALQFGFRWFEFDRDRGFFLNGKPLKLRGVNRHQDFPGLGNAIPAELQSWDAELIKDFGANFIRCSHYPMHPAFLDACDRLGILVYEEIASWQHVGGERFARNARQMMEEMIARDRHHPSIILWGLLNEGRNRTLFQGLHETAHRCDPWRLTVYAENAPDEGKELGTVNIPDVLGLNYKVPHLDELRELLPDLCLMNTEHSNANIDELAGEEHNSYVQNQLWQADKVMSDIAEFEKREWIAGSALWCFHDYGTDYEPTWPMHESGVFDAWRTPKLAAQALKAHWNPEPMVHIANHWTYPGMKDHPLPVRVYSNMETVELYLNETSLGVRGADEGFEWSVPWKAGELLAIGRSEGGAEVRDRRLTAGLRAGIELELSEHHIPADGASIALLTARIVDGNGVPLPTIETPVSLKVYQNDTEGGATIVGIGGLNGGMTRLGALRVAVRAGTTPGRVIIVAESPGIRADSQTELCLT